MSNMTNNSDIKIKYYMDSTNYELNHMITTKPFHISYHNHDFYEVYFFISGNVTYMIEGIEYKLESGDILLTHNKEMHRPYIDFSVPYERYVLWLHPLFIKELELNSINLSTCFEIASEKKQHLLKTTPHTRTIIKNYLNNLKLIVDDTNFGDELLKRSLITTILIHLNRISLEPSENLQCSEEYEPRVNDIIRYINNNITMPITLDELAEHFYLSKYHLCRLFKKNVDMTIYQYIIKKRLIIAKSLLISGSNVKNAFINSGFSDYSNFIKAFKNEFHVSPKEISASNRRW